MNNQIIIKIRKGILILYENELINALPMELFSKAMKRGKGYRRVEKLQKRNEGPVKD